MSPKYKVACERGRRPRRVWHEKRAGVFLIPVIGLDDIKVIFQNKNVAKIRNEKLKYEFLLFNKKSLRAAFKIPIGSSYRQFF